MPTIAIIGPGAIGGTLAAWLDTQPENKVSICARTSFKTLSVDTPFGLLNSEPSVLTDPSDASQVDWVIVATKTYQVASTKPWLDSLCGPNTMVAVAQNGVEHIANLAPFIAEERIVPVIIDCPADRNSPGNMRQRAPIQMTVPNNASSQEFAELFPKENIAITLTDNWTSAAWKKLCINSSGALSVLVNQPSIVASNPEAAYVVRNLLRECIDVGRAEGAIIDDSIIEQIVANQSAASNGSMNSMHADFAAKRPMEWDARNGVIVRLGRTHGIPTPCNEMAAIILQTAETAYLE